MKKEDLSTLEVFTGVLTQQVSQTFNNPFDKQQTSFFIYFTM